MSLIPAISKPAPTVLSTDIGSDVDDTWALAQLLRSPELDPEGEYKARVAMEWTDLEGFEGYLTRRLLGEEYEGKRSDDGGQRSD